MAKIKFSNRKNNFYKTKKFIKHPIHGYLIAIALYLDYNYGLIAFLKGLL